VFNLLDPAVTGLRKSQMDTSYVLHSMPKPTIAMVNGHAVGAGLSLALACDLRIASDKAKFGTAFRNVALSGDYGGSFYMQRLVGMGKARELYFTAEIIQADEALRIGMVTRVVPHEQLAEETLAFAAKLASGPTATYARMKENLNLGEYADLRTLMDQEAQYMRLMGLSNDHREAAGAFVEKRDPKFVGN
jgi:2-(1,2-epoxy-1,2-dihydrophenyl)acetyl-CoA isomerase